MWPRYGVLQYIALGHAPERSRRHLPASFHNAHYEALGVWLAGWSAGRVVVQLGVVHQTREPSRRHVGYFAPRQVRALTILGILVGHPNPLVVLCLGHSLRGRGTVKSWRPEESGVRAIGAPPRQRRVVCATAGDQGAPARDPCGDPLYVLAQLCRRWRSCGACSKGTAESTHFVEVVSNRAAP